MTKEQNNYQAPSVHICKIGAKQPLLSVSMEQLYNYQKVNESDYEQ